MIFPGWIQLTRVCFTTIILFLAAALLPSHARAQQPEFRAYWADAFHNGFFNSNQVTTLVNDLRAGNFNAIIVQARKRGDSYYNSNFEPKALNISPPEFDPLADLIAKAHDTSGGKQRIEVHAWMVTYHIWNPTTASGVPVQTNHPYNLHPDWLMKDVNDNTYIGGQYTFDQGHPGVQQHTFNVAMDIVSNYDVDGINFDYVRYSSINEGYNDVTVARFNQLHGRTGKPLPSDAAWLQFRRDQITALMRKVYLNTIAIKPHVKVSADTICFAPGPTNLAQWYSSSAAWNSVLQDWRGWMEEGIIDLNIPMAYFREHTHAADWVRWSQFAKDFKYNRHLAIGPGVYLNYTTNAILQMRSIRNLTPDGNNAEGMALYSYAVPNLEGVPTSTFHQALTTPGVSVYDPVAPGMFFHRVDPPVMPWKTAPTKGHLKGFVYGGSVTNALDGATVTLAGVIDKNTTSDGTGFYGAVDLPPGSYTITARFPGFDMASANVVITAGVVSTIDLVLSPIDKTPPLTFNISVTNITDTSATVTWTTDESSTSLVEYGTTTNYGDGAGDEVFTLNHSVELSELEPLRVYHFRVTSRDALNNEGVSQDFTFTTLPLGTVEDLIVDNLQARISGTWSTGIAEGRYGPDYRFKSQATGATTAFVEFVPKIITAGDYAVYEWHVEGTNRPLAAPHVIKFDGGTQTNTVNQQTNGAQWNLIGTFKFAAGTNGHVRITDRFTESGKVVMADAIKFVYVPPPILTIVDNPDAIYSGIWIIATAAPDKYSTYYQYATSTVGTANAEAIYTPNLPRAGKYNVSIWYPEGANRTLNARVSISGDNGISLASVNQTTGGGGWRLIGSAKQFAAGTNGFVRISNDTGEVNKIVMADAVRFDYLQSAYLLSQPQSQHVPLGANALFNVEAQGVGPLAYQWRFNGDEIPGATTSALSVPNASHGDVGNYSVLVTNVAGAVMSAPAALTILLPTPAQFNSATILPNSQFKLSLSGQPGNTYAIQASTNLVIWTTLTNITNTDGTFEFIDSTATNAQRFYRAIWPE